MDTINKLQEIFNLGPEKSVQLDGLINSYLSLLYKKIERKYSLVDYDTKDFVLCDSFVTPPSKGEFYVVNSGIYEIVQVTHVPKSYNDVGTIHIRLQRLFKKD